jgi:anaerobic selenocysteine-containing dehydrogenase
MVAFADLILFDTTYLERWDCISLLDRPNRNPEGPADAIRQPILTPDRDVRPFQDVLIELGAWLELPGFVTRDGLRSTPAAIRSTLSITSAGRASGRSRVGTALKGSRQDEARRTRASSNAMSGMAASGSTSFGKTSAISSMPTRLTLKPHSQNEWLRQILGNNRLFVDRAKGFCSII